MKSAASVVAELPADVFRTGDGLISAYLFGSVASGREHTDSDIDIAILLDWNTHPTARARFDARLHVAAGLGAALHRNDVDLVVLNDAPPHLARQIVTTGRRLFCADAEADHAFLRTVTLRAADLEPFLRRTRHVKLAALKR